MKQEAECRSGRGARLTVWMVTLSMLVPFIIVAAGAADPTFIVSDYTVTPAVLMPGDNGTITLILTNTAQAASQKEGTGAVSGGTFATQRTTDINVFIENVHLDANGIVVENDDFDRIGELGPGQSVPVTFVIRAPAKSGIYFPEAWIDVKDGRSTRFPLLVNVNTDIATQKKASLAVHRVLPVQVAPGEEFSVRLMIENTGLTRAGDVTVAVNSTQKSVALASTGSYYVPSLDPGESNPIDLQFTSDRTTPAGINPVTVLVTYTNIDGSTILQTETIGILFKGKAEMAVSSISTDPVRPLPGSPFTLIVRVENTGTDRATSVRAAIDSDFSGTSEAFIGSIDKDSDAPAIFHLQAARDGSVPVAVSIQYTDDYGTHQFKETTTVTTAPSSTLVTAMVLLVVLAAGCIAAYWYFRIRPGQKNGA